MSALMPATARPYERYREATTPVVVDAFVKHWFGESIPSDASDNFIIWVKFADRRWEVTINRHTAWWRIRSDNPSATYESHGIISLGQYLFGVSAEMIEEDLAVALGGRYELAP